MLLQKNTDAGQLIEITIVLLKIVFDWLKEWNLILQTPFIILDDHMNHWIG